MQSFSTEFTVDQTPQQAYRAITDVRGWWSGDIEGVTDRIDGEFTYRFRDIHRSKQRITELIPDRRVVWRVLDAYLAFTEDPGEWVGSEIVFEIARHDERTTVRFDHIGLTPSIECYEKCSSAWDYYLNSSLKQLIETGVGVPNPSEG